MILDFGLRNLDLKNIAASDIIKFLLKKLMDKGS